MRSICLWTVLALTPFVRIVCNTRTDKTIRPSDWYSYLMASLFGISPWSRLYLADILDHIWCKLFPDIWNIFAHPTMAWGLREVVMGALIAASWEPTSSVIAIAWRGGGLAIIMDWKTTNTDLYVLREKRLFIVLQFRLVERSHWLNFQFCILQKSSSSIISKPPANFCPIKISTIEHRDLFQI